MKKNKTTAVIGLWTIILSGLFLISDKAAYAHNSRWSDCDNCSRDGEGPYVYDRSREIERNLRQAPFNRPFRYDRQKEIRRNLRQKPRYYGDSSREDLRYLRDSGIIF